MKKSDIIEGETLDLVDLLKAHPSAGVKALAEAMKKEGGENPFEWGMRTIAKGSSDPQALCAAAHLLAFGKTPSQRKAEKG